MLKGIWKRKACKTTCLKETLYFPVYFPCRIKETDVKVRNQKWPIFYLKGHINLSMLFLVTTYMIFMHFSTIIRNLIVTSPQRYPLIWGFSSFIVAGITNLVMVLLWYILSFLKKCITVLNEIKDNFLVEKNKNCYLGISCSLIRLQWFARQKAS